MSPEIVLLVGLSDEESEAIDRLLASIKIQLESHRAGNLEEPAKALAGREICLVVLRADETIEYATRMIRRAKSLFTVDVPILVLIPGELPERIVPCLRAGADDYWILPLDETGFPLHFAVLLECGDAVLQAERGHRRESAPVREDSGHDLWRSILDGLKEGMSLFSPGRLIREKKTHPIARRWQRLERLGDGRFGEVWRVRETESHLQAVAKVPRCETMNSCALHAAAILKRLRHHPNVVQLIEVVKEEGRIVLVEEYIPGPTLRERLDAGFSPKEKEGIVLQLLSVTEYAHLHRIMHRDIKPENIIITHGGELKLIDFGIAKEIDIRGAGFATAGTYQFMPPEQILGKSCIASDVWALGVILYLLSTGRLPFFHENETYLVDLVQEAPPAAPRSLDARIPVELERVILKCLEKAVENRYANAGELLCDLLDRLPGFGDGTRIPD